jgi:hypothetical protein
MKTGKTFIVSLEFERGHLVERQDVDGAVDIGTQSSYRFTDPQTLIFQEECTCPPQTWRLTPNGDSFTLDVLTPPRDERDRVAVQILFESGPFTLQP